MKKLLTTLLLLSACSMNFDYPRVPSQNPHTGQIENKSIYYPAHYQIVDCHPKEHNLDKCRRLLR